MRGRVRLFLLLSGILSIPMVGLVNAESTESVLGYWSFDEGSGTIAHDNSIYGNHGEIYNVTWASGVVEGALHFNGTDDSYVEVPNKPELTPTKRLIIEAWIKPESYTTWHMAIVYKGDLEQTGCFGERSYSLWARKDGGLHFAFTLEDEDCQREYWTEAGIVNTGEWSHIKAQLDTKEEKVLVFVNGEEVYVEEHKRFIDAPMDSKSIKVGNLPLRIGGMFRSAGDQSNFKGSIDEVKICTSFSGAGSGTEDDPYIITNVYQLQEMNYDLDAWYELGNDIDASETETWNGGKGFVPIGDYDNKFTGHFDGKGHKITNLYINLRDVASYTGLFGCADTASEIKNIGLVDVDIAGNRDVGGLVGLNYGVITNCYATGGVSGGDYGDISHTGGLVGSNYYGTISNCYATGSVINWWVGTTGGFVGKNYSGGTITNSYSTGDVLGFWSTVGGFAGRNEGVCNSCFWDKETSRQSTSAGGEGKTTAEMKQEVTFTNWDFDTVWGIIEGQDYPFLREVPPPIPTLEWPLAGDIGERQVLLGFGDIWTWTYCGGLPKKHTGVDLKASAGEDVCAAYDGIIVKIYDLSSVHNWGKGIIIEHSGFTTAYMHVNPVVEQGAYVNKGERISTIANIKGDEHLHFGVRNSPYSYVSHRGALPQKHGSSDYHNGVFTGCESDPLFPEKFVDPMTPSYEIAQLLSPPEVTPRPESENPQPASLAFDAPLVISPVAPPSWYGEESWQGVAIRLLDRFLGLLFPLSPTILIGPGLHPLLPIGTEGEQAHEWKGDNAMAVTVVVAGANQTQTDAVQIREASDAFIWKEVTIPENAYGLMFDTIFLGEADGDNLIVSFDDKTLFIDDGTLFSDTLWAKPGIIYIGDLAGETGILQFRLKSESDPNMSILIRNIAFTNYSQVGDFDGDMDVDMADLHTLVLHWLVEDCNYPSWCEGTDLNYNGFVDFIDYATFAENWLWEKIPADFDIDGDVDFADYAILANQWRQPPAFPSADIAPEVPDSVVDMLDLAVLAEHWLEGLDN